MYEYPYGNGQQLSLDWFLSEWKNLLAAWEAEKNGVEGALQAEIDRAEAALADVFSARDAAAQSAANALESKNAAEQSASDASGYLSTVQQNATAAQDAASAAAQSESGAADSAQTALASKNNAANSERNAAQSEANARASKDAAAQSAADALANKDAAAQSAADALANKDAAAQSASDAEDAAASVEASTQQIATNASDIVILKEANNYLIGKNIIKSNVEDSGNRISFYCSNASQTARRLQTMTIFQAGDYGVDNNVMSFETSGYTENGVLKYPIQPLPQNISIPFKNEGLIIITDNEIIGRCIKTKYIVTSLATQNKKVFGEQISIFNEDIAKIRTCVVWHYINNTPSENVIIPNSESMYIATPME